MVQELLALYLKHDYRQYLSRIQSHWFFPFPELTMITKDPPERSKILLILDLADLVI